MAVVSRSAELLRIATSGSVDDGKSTLIGRLLFDSKQVLTDQLAHVEEVSERRGDGYVNLALLTDGLRAEREQGITIDVAYRYFHTPRRKFIIADTPGHEQYTRNMVTGASTAELSLVLVDARAGRGRAEQAPRLHRLAAAHPAPRGVREQDGPRRLERGALRGDPRGVHRVRLRPGLRGHPVRPGQRAARRQRGRALGEHALVPGPGAAAPPRARGGGVGPQLRGHRASRCSGWSAPTPPSAPTTAATPARWPAACSLPGDELVALPSGRSTRIAAIDSYDGELDAAYPPMSVTLLLEDDLDLGRGRHARAARGRARARPRADRRRLLDGRRPAARAAPATRSSTPPAPPARWSRRSSTAWTSTRWSRARPRSSA